ncbi:MAG: helix-turn-helix transcriptional regulator [Planctomycetaceae bacterium]|nr:helix-turn-helix domain-containing protein [Planctomycetaceae bacterium]
MSLGQQLRKARLSAGMTQEALAGNAGVSREYISLLESDKKSPTVNMLLRLCAAMNVRAWILLRRVQDSQTR